MVNRKVQDVISRKSSTSPKEFWKELLSVVIRCKPIESDKQRFYDQEAWKQLHKILSPWARSYYASKNIKEYSHIDEFSDYFIAWLSTRGRLESFDPEKGSIYQWLKLALKKAYADFWKDLGGLKRVTASVSKSPDLNVLPEDTKNRIEDRLRILEKPSGSFTLEWRGEMSSADRDDLLRTFGSQEDKKAVTGLFQRAHIPEFLSDEGLNEVPDEQIVFRQTLQEAAETTKEKWRELLQSIPLPLRTRFIALHHASLGPLTNEEIPQFEREFDLSYSEAIDELDTDDHDIVLSILGRSREWGYQVETIG